MRCKHSHAWEFYLNGEIHGFGKPEAVNRLHKWCPDCGAVAYWNAKGTRLIWMKPQNKK